MRAPQASTRKCWCVHVPLATSTAGRWTDPQLAFCRKTKSEHGHTGTPSTKTATFSRTRSFLTSDAAPPFLACRALSPHSALSPHPKPELTINPRFAAKAGAKHVIGVDMSTIIDKAKQIVEVNGLSSKITLLQGKMEDVVLPFDKVDIII